MDCWEMAGTEYPTRIKATLRVVKNFDLQLDDRVTEVIG
jgi:hypothetical protein